MTFLESYFSVFLLTEGDIIGVAWFQISQAVIHLASTGNFYESECHPVVAVGHHHQTFPPN